MKRILLFIISVCAFCCCFIFGAGAVSESGFEYSVDDGRATIIGYSGAGGGVTIPETLGDYPVVAIGEYAFENCSEITSLTIGNNIEIIESYAFSRCSNIEKIFWNVKEVYSVSYTAFSEVGSDVERFEVIFGNTVKYIPGSIFSYNEFLDSVTVGDSVESIGYAAFADCTDIDEIIWNAVNASCSTNYYEGIFEQAGTKDGAVSVIFGSKVQTVPERMFYGCHNIKNVVISDRVKRIGREAFTKCEYLTSVTIGKAVEHISEYAFSDCYRINQINWNAVNVSLEECYHETVFSDCGIVGKGINVIFGNSVKHIPASLFSAAKVISVTMSDSIISIGSGVFYDCDIKSVVIPKNANKIGSRAFANCLALEKIYWNAENIPEYGEEVFFNIGEEAINDVEIVFSDDVKIIPEDAFSGCKALKKISVGDTIMTVGNGAFYGCDQLLEVYFKGSKEQWALFEIEDYNECLTDAVFSYGHKHTLETKLTKATLANNGLSSTKCKTCIYYNNTYTIYRPNTFSLSSTKYTYDGKVKTPTLTIKDVSGKTLKNKTDYTVKYDTNRKSIGKHSIVITFKGNYSGTKTIYFYILPTKTKKITATQSSTYINSSWKKVTGATGYKVELLNSNGKKVKTVHTSKLIYKFKKLKSGTVYNVKVTAYKTIDKKKHYSIVSKTLNTCTSPAKITKTSDVIVSYFDYSYVYFGWNRVKGASGYEVQYSKNTKMKKAKTIKAGAKADFVEFDMENQKTKYYVRVRAYKKVGNKKIYGSYSKIRKVSI